MLCEQNDCVSTQKEKVSARNKCKRTKASAMRTKQQRKHTKGKVSAQNKCNRTKACAIRTKRLRIRTKGNVTTQKTKLSAQNNHPQQSSPHPIKIISHNRYKVVYYKVVVFERVSDQLLRVLGTKQ